MSRDDETVPGFRQKKSVTSLPAGCGVDSQPRFPVSLWGCFDESAVKLCLSHSFNGESTCHLPFTEANYFEEALPQMKLLSASHLHLSTLHLCNYFFISFLLHFLCFCFSPERREFRVYLVACLEKVEYLS